MRTRTLVALALLGAAFAGCMDLEAEEREIQDVSITYCRSGHGLGDTVRVAGEVKNSSSERSDYDIEYVVTNPEGVQLDSGSLWVRNVDPGQTALWEQFVDGSGEVRCALASVNRWAS